MVKLLIGNLDRLQNRRIRLIKGPGATSNLLTQTGAIFENDNEVGMCLAPLVEESDIRIFPQSNEEFNAFVNQYGFNTLINPLTNGVLSSTGKEITINTESNQNTTAFKYGVGYSFDKASVDSLLADNTPSKVIGTRQFYSGEITENPVIVTNNVTVADLVSNIQSGYLFNDRYIYIIDTTVDRESKLNINKRNLDLTSTRALYKQTTVGIKSTVNFIAPPLEILGRTYLNDSTDFQQLFAVYPDMVNATVNYTTGAKPAVVTTTNGYLKTVFDWNDFNWDNYTNNGIKGLRSGFLFNKGNMIDIVNHLKTIPSSTIIGKIYSNLAPADYVGDMTAGDFISIAWSGTSSETSLSIDENNYWFPITVSTSVADKDYYYAWEFNYTDSKVKLDKTFRIEYNVKRAVIAVASDVQIFPTNQADYEEFLTLAETSLDNPYTDPNSTINVSSNTAFDFTLKDQWYIDAPAFAITYSFNKVQLDKLIASSLPDTHVVGIGHFYAGVETSTPTKEDKPLTLGEIRQIREGMFFEVNGRLVMYDTASIINDLTLQTVSFNLDDGTGYLTDSATLEYKVTRQLLAPDYTFKSFPLDAATFDAVSILTNLNNDRLDPFNTTGVTAKVINNDSTNVTISGSGLATSDVVGKNLINALSFSETIVPYLEKLDPTTPFVGFDDLTLELNVGQILNGLSSGQWYIKDRTVYIYDNIERKVDVDGFSKTITNTIFYTDTNETEHTTWTKQTYDLKVLAKTTDTRTFPQDQTEFNQWKATLSTEQQSQLIELFNNTDVELSGLGTDQITYVVKNVPPLVANDPTSERYISSGYSYSKLEVDKLLSSNLPLTTNVADVSISLDGNMDNLTISLDQFKARVAEMTVIGDRYYDVIPAIAQKLLVYQNQMKINLDNGSGYLTEKTLTETFSVSIKEDVVPVDSDVRLAPLSQTEFDNLIALKPEEIRPNILDLFNNSDVVVTGLGTNDVVWELNNWPEETNKILLIGFSMNKTQVDKLIASSLPDTHVVGTLRTYIGPKTTTPSMTSQVLDLGSLRQQIAYFTLIDDRYYMAGGSINDVNSLSIINHDINLDDGTGYLLNVTMKSEASVNTTPVQQGLDFRIFPNTAIEFSGIRSTQMTMNPDVDYVDYINGSNVVFNGLGTETQEIILSDYKVDQDKTSGQLLTGYSFDKERLDEFLASDLAGSVVVISQKTYQGPIIETSPTLVDGDITKETLGQLKSSMVLYNDRYYLLTGINLDGDVEKAMYVKQGTSKIGTETTSSLTTKVTYKNGDITISCEGATNTTGWMKMTGTYDIYIDDQTTPVGTSQTPAQLASTYASGQTLKVGTQAENIEFEIYPRTAEQMAKVKDFYAVSSVTNIFDPWSVDKSLPEYQNFTVTADTTAVTQMTYPFVNLDDMGKRYPLAISFKTSDFEKLMDLGIDDTQEVLKHTFVRTEDQKSYQISTMDYGSLKGQASRFKFVDGERTVCILEEIDFSSGMVIGSNIIDLDFGNKIIKPMEFGVFIVGKALGYRYFPQSSDEYEEFIEKYKTIDPEGAAYYINPFTLPNYKQSLYNVTLSRTTTWNVSFDMTDPGLVNRKPASMFAIHWSFAESIKERSDDNTILGKLDFGDITVGLLKTLLSRNLTVNSTSGEWHVISDLTNVNTTLDYDYLYTENLTSFTNISLSLEPDVPYSSWNNSEIVTSVKQNRMGVMKTDARSFPLNVSEYDSAIQSTSYINPYTIGTLSVSEQSQFALSRNWVVPASEAGKNFICGVLISKDQLDKLVSSPVSVNVSAQDPVLKCTMEIDGVETVVERKPKWFVDNVGLLKTVQRTNPFFVTRNYYLYTVECPVATSEVLIKWEVMVNGWNESVVVEIIEHTSITVES